MAIRSKAEVSIGTSSIASDPAGFSRIAKFYQLLSRHSDTEIQVNMGELRWVDAHLAAALRIVAKKARLQGNRVTYVHVRPAVADILRRNGFFVSRTGDQKGTTMPLTEFDLGAPVAFSQYAKRHLDRPEMPKMTDALRSKFFEGVDELFANCAIHSKTQLPAVVCGQFFPKQNLLDFAIADGGRTFAGALDANDLPYASDAQAIDWAMRPFNTTRRGDVPGGLGSKRSFASSSS